MLNEYSVDSLEWWEHSDLPCCSWQCLAKNAKESASVPAPLKILKSTTKFKKHITIVCDRLGKGSVTMYTQAFTHSYPLLLVKRHNFNSCFCLHFENAFSISARLVAKPDAKPDSSKEDVVVADSKVTAAAEEAGSSSNAAAADSKTGPNLNPFRHDNSAEPIYLHVAWRLCRLNKQRISVEDGIVAHVESSATTCFLNSLQMCW